jgi:hypothetical protein
MSHFRKSKVGVRGAGVCGRLQDRDSPCFSFRLHLRRTNDLNFQKIIVLRERDDATELEAWLLN